MFCKIVYILHLEVCYYKSVQNGKAAVSSRKISSTAGLGTLILLLRICFSQLLCLVCACVLLINLRIFPTVALVLFLFVFCYQLYSH